MFKMNLFLKLIIIIIFSILLFFVNNYIVLLLLVSLLFVVGVLAKNNISLLISVLLVILLILSNYLSWLLIIFKILFIFNMIYIFIKNLSVKEKKYFTYMNNKYDKSTRRETFYNQVFQNIYDKAVKNVKKIYKNEVSIDEKVKKDLERKYLQAKIRFYGYKDESFNSINFSWNRIDTELALFFFIVFLICIIFG